MGDAFLSLSTRERGDILRTLAAHTGRPALILEKDIWLCWVLGALFAIPDRHPMAFKGGSSLSKVYRIIDRFSEDVDITLDYRAFDDGFDPFAPGVSRSGIKRFSHRLRTYVKTYIRDVVVNALTAASEDLATASGHAIQIVDDGETVRVAYPSAVEKSTGCLRSEILLEFGGRNVIEPNMQHTIVPDIAALVPDLDYPTASVTVLSASRTFWEKATLIHVECHRRRLADRPDRLSRHWFDMACLASHDVGRAALVDRVLLEDVVRLKKIFFNASYAHYDRCLDGRLRLVPDDDQLPGLRADYDAMRTAGIVGDGAPDFESLVERIRDVETRANGSR